MWNPKRNRINYELRRDRRDSAGEADKAFEWLERAYNQRDGGLSEMKGDPRLRNIERDPRYRAFLQKMKLPLD